MLDSYLQEIRKTFLTYSTEVGKAAIRKFVPAAQNIYGVRMVIANELAKKFKHGGFELVVALWKSGAYEEKLLAAKILGRIAKQDPGKTLALIEKFSRDISDWAVCDTLAMQSPKPIVKTHAKEIFAISNRLIKSKNLWQRRLALVLSEWYTRDKLFHPQIRKLISIVSKDEEYYVKKAIVWIEKNFSKGK
jgi:3-methyladenine DNA glycosylase AlkD